jgi:hypothetical protein
MIIESAVPIIGHYSYYVFSIRMLAEACGLNVPGVLHHFGSKEDLPLLGFPMAAILIGFPTADLPDRPTKQTFRWTSFAC